MPILGIMLIGVIFMAVYFVVLIFSSAFGFDPIKATGNIFYFLYWTIWITLTFSFVCLLFGYLFKKPSVIIGSIKTYSKYSTNSLGLGTIEKVTFNFIDGSRRFFNDMHFKKNLWSSSVRPIGPNYVFFVDESRLFPQKSITVWGIKTEDESFVFVDDMSRPSLFFKLLKIGIFITSSVAILASFKIYIMKKCPIMLLIDSILGRENFLLEIAPYTTAELLNISVECIIKYLNPSNSPFLIFLCLSVIVLLYQPFSFFVKKHLFERRMQLLDEAGVPRPLG